MTKYIKTAVTEFEQFDGSSKMMERYFINSIRHVFAVEIGIGNPKVSYGAGPWNYSIRTGNGDESIEVGDWILTAETGLFYKVSQNDFKENYEPITEAYTK